MSEGGSAHGTSAPPAPLPGPTTEAAKEHTKVTDKVTAEAPKVDSEALATLLSEVEKAGTAFQGADRTVLILEAEEASEGRVERIWEALTGTATDEATALAEARAARDAALQTYRSKIAEYIAARLLTATDAEGRTRVLQELASEFQKRWNAAQANAMDAVDKTGGERDVKATQEAVLRRMWTLEEALAIAANRTNPKGLADTLDSLAKSVPDTRTQRERETGQTESNFRMLEWFRDVERKLKVERYILLTEVGEWVDATGKPLAAGARSRVAADRLTKIAQFLDSTAWRDDDTRKTQAAELRAHIKRAYRFLDYVGGSMDMAEYFRAVSQTIRKRQVEVNDWFLKEYLGQSEGDAGTWWGTIKAGYSTGLGTRLRILDIGDDSIGDVRLRITAMNLEADAAVAALQEAATKPNPDDLSILSYRLLESLGYIVTNPDGSKEYRLPTADRAAARVTRVKLAGATWLDVLSPGNAFEIMLSVAVPELAAARVGAWMTRVGASARAVLAARVLADQGLGVGLDVAMQWLKADPKTRNLKAIALESLASSWLGMLTRMPTDKLARVGVDAAERTVIRRGLNNVAEHLADPDTYDLAVRTLGDVLGLAPDLLSQMLIEAVKGHSMTKEEMLAALLGSAMNAGAAMGSRRITDFIESRFGDDRAREIDQILRTAARVDRQMNLKAQEAFKKILGDSALDRDAGSRIFEALRLGDLTWEQLQRVYTVTGSEMDTLMDQVRIERDIFVNGIASRARVLAEKTINLEFDTKIREVREQLGDTAEAETRVRELEAQRADELSKIYPAEFEPMTAFRFAIESMDIPMLSTDQILERFSEGLDPTKAKDKKKLDELETWRSLDHDEVVEKALEWLGSRHVDALGAAKDQIAPGSAGATSDVDRSWASEYLRRAAQAIVAMDMARGRMDGGIGPTTARAMDVNEYNNSMTGIMKIIIRRKEFAGLEVELSIGPKGKERTLVLHHRDVVLANSLAAAMLPMDSEFRTRFMENKLEGLTGDARKKMEDMLAWAQWTLQRSQDTLDRYVREQGGDPNDPDTQLRARDRLYGDRMRELDDLLHRIEQTEDGQEKLRLMSQWELLTNTALRDGIETYSDMANLDIIVIRMQSETKEDGSKLSPVELMRNPKFALGEGNLLAHLERSQIESMLNDQILMFMHHIHALWTGHESPAKVTRSLAKYAERALLAMNLLGEFDPDNPGKYQTLFEATQALITYKDKPKELMATLLGLAPDEVMAGLTDPALRETAALRWYLQQLEGLPGMKGMTEPPGFSSSTRERMASLGRSLTAREWQQAEDAARASGGEEAVTRLRALEYLRTQQRLDVVRAELARLRKLASYAPEHRGKAERLLKAIEINELRLELTPTGTLDRGIDPGTQRGFPGAFEGEHMKSVRLETERLRAELAAIPTTTQAADGDLGVTIGRLEAEQGVLESRGRSLEGALTDAR